MWDSVNTCPGRGTLQILWLAVTVRLPPVICSSHCVVGRWPLEVTMVLESLTSLFSATPGRDDHEKLAWATIFHPQILFQTQSSSFSSFLSDFDFQYCHKCLGTLNLVKWLLNKCRNTGEKGMTDLLPLFLQPFTTGPCLPVLLGEWAARSAGRRERTSAICNLC